MLKQINLEEANLVSHKQTKFYLPLHFYDSVTLSTYLVRYALKKIRGLFGNFSHKGGGGVFPIPKTFVN